MQRVMIIGQPGSGKSTLARALAEVTFLLVIHMDHIHWQSGWIERSDDQKTHMVLEAIKEPAWIVEGGHSKTYPQRLARADTLIWLDLPLLIRMRRVLFRTLRHCGRARPDLPDGCPEQVDPEFFRFIWRTRHTSRANLSRAFETAPTHVARIYLTSGKAADRYLADLKKALEVGNLGIPHR